MNILFQHKKLLLILLLLASNSFSQTIDFSFKNNNLPLEKRVEILVSQMTLEEKIGQMVNAAPAIPRLDVPSYNWWNESLHGVARNGLATVFPQGIGMGATFDPKLIERVASAISTEARAKYEISQKAGNHSKFAGVTFWSPTVNIFRDPRYGRGQESYSEDPFLMSKIGVAFVKGLQGDDPKYLKAAACAKHFVLHSGPEKDKMEFDVKPSKQDLYETYFPAFEALVTEAKVEGVMSAYNMVYGYPSSTSSFLMKETLIDKWKFDGYITSDCDAIGGVGGKGKFYDSPMESAAEALKVGLNLNCGNTYRNLKKAIDAGLITEELINERVQQVFKTRFKYNRSFTSKCL